MTSPETKRYCVVIEQLMVHTFIVEAKDEDAAQAAASLRYTSECAIGDCTPPEGCTLDFHPWEIIEIDEVPL